MKKFYPSGDYYFASGSIQIDTRTQTEKFTTERYKGNFKEISPLNIDNLIRSIDNDPSLTNLRSDGPPSPKKSRIDNFQNLLLDALKPVKSFITCEAELQFIIHGMLMDQTLNNGERIKVFSEATVANGRPDIQFLTINHNFEETTYGVMECKYDGSHKDALKQIKRYSKYSKETTDLRKAVGVAIVFCSKPNNNNGDFVTVSFSSHQVDHSSQEDELSSSQENREVRKQKSPNRVKTCLQSNIRRKREFKCTIYRME